MRKAERTPSQQARPRAGVAEISELAKKLSVTDSAHLHSLSVYNEDIKITICPIISKSVFSHSKSYTYFAKIRPTIIAITE